MKAWSISNSRRKIHQGAGVVNGRTLLWVEAGLFWPAARCWKRRQRLSKSSCLGWEYIIQKCRKGSLSDSCFPYPSSTHVALLIPHPSKVWTHNPSDVHRDVPLKHAFSRSENQLPVLWVQQPPGVYTHSCILDVGVWSTIVYTRSLWETWASCMVQKAWGHTQTGVQVLKNILKKRNSFTSI